LPTPPPFAPAGVGTPPLDTGDIVVMDNLPAHKAAAATVEIANRRPPES